ncbi:MAG: 50S ribosomal protein L22 [Thermoplasmata archaeon]|nr:50S ribosomal protein L22 [Thermoplasmata archaeon]
MSKLGYTKEWDPETTSRALGKELTVSPKKTVEVCRALRGMMVEEAKGLLNDVIEGKKAITYKRYNKTVAHKSNAFPKRGPGGYPKNVAKALLKVLQSAQDNAEFKGLGFENMKIVTIASHRGRVTEGQKPRAQGRATPWNQETTTVEVVLEEVEEVGE